MGTDSVKFAGSLKHRDWYPAFSDISLGGMKASRERFGSDKISEGSRNNG